MALKPAELSKYTQRTVKLWVSLSLKCFKKLPVFHSMTFFHVSSSYLNLNGQISAVISERRHTIQTHLRRLMPDSHICHVLLIFMVLCVGSKHTIKNNTEA